MGAEPDAAALVSAGDVALNAGRMSFLAPLFLFGALAVVGPLLFHLVKRTTRERMRFSSLMFLRPTPPRVSRKSRLEHWLLLLLRALALLLLAMAFARPFFKSLADQNPAAAGTKRVVVLLDASASLRRDGLWSEARSKARRAVEDAGPTADVALALFQGGVVPLVSFEEWRSTPVEGRLDVARTRLDAAEPGWGPTGLATALTTAAEWMADAPEATEREIVLVSDLQEGSRLDGLQGHQWPEGVRVRVEAIFPEKKGNAGLQLAPTGALDAETKGEGARVRVVNAADASREAFQVGWEGGPAVDVYVPPGQMRLATVPWPSAGPTAGTLRLTGDDAPFDDTLAVVPPPKIDATVLHAGPDEAAEPRGPLFFLRHALPRSDTLTVELKPLAPEAGEAALLVVTGPLEAAQSAEVRRRLDAGGTALVLVRGEEMADMLAATLGGPRPSISTKKPATYAMLGRIDFAHPLFEPFADPRFSDFTKIRFWRFSAVDATAWPGAVAVADFDDGSAAIVDVPVGKGRAFVFGSGWHPDDSQLALSSKFPSLVARCLDLGGRIAAPATQLTVGDAPEEHTAKPGLVKAGNETLAVNLDPAESRTAPLPLEDLEKMGVPVTNPAAAAPAKAAEPPDETLAGAAEAEARQKLWRWLIAAAAAVLLVETLLGRWFTNRAAAPAEA